MAQSKRAVRSVDGSAVLPVPDKGPVAKLFEALVITHTTYSETHNRAKLNISLGVIVREIEDKLSTLSRTDTEGHEVLAAKATGLFGHFIAVFNLPLLEAASLCAEFGVRARASIFAGCLPKN